MKNLGIKHKILASITLPMVIFITGFLYYSFQANYENLLAQKKNATQNYIHVAHNLVESYYIEFKEGRLSEDDAKKRAIHGVHNMRYGEGLKDYYWINDLDEVIIEHPKEKLIGKKLTDFKDKAGQNIFVEFNKIVTKNPEGGFYFYKWPSKDDAELIVDKLSYVKMFKDWKWTIGTGIYIDDVKHEAFNITKNLGTILILSMFVILLVTNLVLNYVVTGPLVDMVNKLKNQHDSLKSITDNVLNSSEELSSSSEQQSSGLHQTVAALTEIRSMVKRTVSETSHTLDLSNQSESYANEGKSVLTEFQHAFKEIQKTFKDLSNTLEKNNDDVKQILHLISEVKDKTKVINDIVFQTKLLSFNASVEAARAGEHGKGFSIVAEEVGNLANLSGSSSDEIESILNENIRRIEDIVKIAEAKVQVQIDSSSKNIENGFKISEDSMQAFEKIIGLVKEVHNSINEVTMATQEQSDGVENISAAMHEFEQVNNNTTKISQNMASIAQKLREESSSLNGQISALDRQVYGDKKSA